MRNQLTALSSSQGLSDPLSAQMALYHESCDPLPEDDIVETFDGAKRI